MLNCYYFLNEIAELFEILKQYYLKLFLCIQFLVKLFIILRRRHYRVKMRERKEAVNEMRVNAI